MERESNLPKAPGNASRRSFLKYFGAAAAGAAIGVTAGRYILPSPPVTTQTGVKTTAEAPSCSASLRAAAEARGLLVGSAVSAETHESPDLPQPIWQDERYASLLLREFDYLTPGNYMKWEPIEKWGFALADAFVSFASQHQIKVKGHTLIGAGQLPARINSAMSAGDVQLEMQKHVRQIVGRYSRKVYAWDVVNEAVDDNEGLRKTIFLEKLGEGYITDAFRLAHEADPSALLFYNDYGAEAAGGSQKAKSDRVYELVKRLVADDVPIHGVGLQMHLNAWDCPMPEDVAANVRRLAALGLKVNISEMDVRISEEYLPGTLPERLEIQRRIYHDMIAACLKEEGFAAVTFWGFTDAHSWIDIHDGPDDPLLFDEKYQAKPAYWGVLDALLSG
jgi:GH35 family endo-1,4-beta-xylanase